MNDILLNINQIKTKTSLQTLTTKHVTEEMLGLFDRTDLIEEDEYSMVDSTSMNPSQLQFHYQAKAYSSPKFIYELNNRSSSKLNNRAERGD